MSNQGSQNQIHSKEGEKRHTHGHYQGLQKERTIKGPLPRYFRGSINKPLKRSIQYLWRSTLYSSITRGR